MAPDVYVWKINDRYAGGVADAFYHGPSGDILFVEYKYNVKLPRQESSYVRPNLSSLQKEWLTQRQKAGINVAVVLGTPIGGLFLEDFLMDRTLEEFRQNTLSSREIAKEIGSVLRSNC